MEAIFDFLDNFFSINVFGNLNLYQLLSALLKYIFVIIVFYFIYSIIKVIYYDVKGTMRAESIQDTYLKLLNKPDEFSFKLQEYYFIGDNNTIGRDELNTIVIEDKFLSKYHARIIRDNESDMYMIEDLDSANGTYLNGEEVHELIELKTNDIIELGQLKFLFVEGEAND
ncbi:MAG: FHA domain-containing protein [Peptoniphilaceae bacterium]|nr:FHA domain-containing protein [Peptoniphilaceae bacterium]MDD7383541.1 FHA domain-containing protein [Peptoniphilaceae bacterium]MDY3738714.1 FHA domain-containing protein [Peptoniphilaceae bacterium]